MYINLLPCLYLFSISRNLVYIFRVASSSPMDFKSSLSTPILWCIIFKYGILVEYYWVIHAAWTYPYMEFLSLNHLIMKSVNQLSRVVDLFLLLKRCKDKLRRNIFIRRVEEGRLFIFIISYRVVENELEIFSFSRSFLL